MNFFFSLFTLLFCRAVARNERALKDTAVKIIKKATTMWTECAACCCCSCCCAAVLASCAIRFGNWRSWRRFKSDWKRRAQRSCKRVLNDQKVRTQDQKRERERANTQREREGERKYPLSQPVSQVKATTKNALKETGYSVSALSDPAQFYWLTGGPVWWPPGGAIAQQAPSQG